MLCKKCRKRESMPEYSICRVCFGKKVLKGKRKKAVERKLLKKKKIKNYKIGSVIRYKTHKEGKPRTVKVTEKHKNVKNRGGGFAGYGHNKKDKKTFFWGYDFQIYKIVKR